MIIDCHCHYCPREISQLTLPNARERFFPNLPEVSVRTFGLDYLWDTDAQLRDMDAAGVDAIVLGPHAGLHVGVGAARFVNDRSAEVMRAHPGRFIGLACAPVDTPEGLRELERAIVELGLRGAFIPCQVNGRTLDDRVLWPFYQLVQKLNVPVFVHPSIIPSSYNLIPVDEPPYLHRLIGREFDVVVETVRLVYGGVLDEFPSLRIVMAHFGGGLSSIAERIQSKPPHVKVWKDFMSYLPRMYFDMAGFSGGMNAVRCALTTIPATSLVFGTDYPLVFSNQPDRWKRYIDGIRALPLPAETIEGILGGTALHRLFDGHIGPGAARRAQ